MKYKNIFQKKIIQIRPKISEQQRELYEKCSSTRTTLNGVSGLLFTGPNWNTLFLPVAGSRWEESLVDAGSCGYYWSRTLNPDYSNDACPLFFSSLVYWYDFHRYSGFSVRAVRVS